MNKLIRIAVFFSLIISTASVALAEELTLSQCINIALENNLSLKSGELNTELGKSQTRQAYGNLLPKISASAGMSAVDYNNWDLGESASISAGLTLYSPGMYTGLRASKLSEQVSLETYHQIRSDIVSQVKSFYFKILSTSELMDVYQENIRVADENLRRTKQMYALGTITESDVLKSEVQKGDFQSQYLNYKQLYLSYLRSLNVLLGRRVRDDLKLVPVDVEDIHIPEYSQAYNLMLENNSTLKSLRLNQSMSKVSLMATKESFLPSLSASYAYSYTPDGTVVTSQSAGLTASWTLFNGFNRNLTVQQKKIGVRQADLDFKNTLLAYEKSLVDLYTQYDIYSQLIQVNLKRLSSAKRDFEIVNQQYRIGNVTILDRMQAQISVLSAESALSEAKYSRMVIEAEINKLINK